MRHVRLVGKERAANITIDSSIVELGLDSLERMEIIASLEDHYGGRFPEEVLPTIETPREVAAAIELYLGAGEKPAAERREIQPSDDSIELFPEYIKLKAAIAANDASGMPNPYFRVHEAVIDDTTVIAGRELTSFSSYNYLGMSGDPVVSAAAKAAIDQFGTGVSASRLVSGQKTVHLDIEEYLAKFLGAEAAITMVSGHQTNESTIGHLFGAGDLILHDALAHNSIVQGAILSGARRRPFAHNDVAACERLLNELRPQYRRVCVAIEGVYSMDGDISDLPAFVALKRKHRAMLYVDEAHSIGVLGRTGRGITEHWNVPASDVDILMGTISKGIGSCGGYIVGGHALIQYLKYTVPSFVFSNGMSPPVAAAALAALQLLEREPERLVRLRERAALFLSLARAAGLNTGPSEGTPIVPVIFGNSELTMRLSNAMFDRGVNVAPILYPAVEERAARLRFFITTKHSEQQIRDTVAILLEEIAKIEPSPVGASVGSNGAAHHATAIPA